MFVLVCDFVYSCVFMFCVFVFVFVSVTYVCVFSLCVVMFGVRVCVCGYFCVCSFMLEYV